MIDFISKKWRRYQSRTRAELLYEASENVNRMRSHVLEEKGHENIIRLGLEGRGKNDLYHLALTVRWSVFFYASLVFYVILNIGFSLAYMLVPAGIANARPGHFSDYFFFSVQTLSTVGYGVMSPVRMGTNIIVSFEVLAGMMLNALATGLVFARFSRPRARVLFSRHAVITTSDALPSLTIRIANCRNNIILSADVEMTLARLVRGKNGRLIRRFDPLPLVQSHSPIFRYTFVAAHVIDEKSPLHKLDLDTLQAEEAEILVTVTGTDDITAQTLFARTAYGFEHVRRHHRFVDIIGHTQDGYLAVDFSRFHDIEPHGVDSQ